MADSWWLYMIECKGGGIYVGITRDVERRYQRHVNGTGAMFTRLNRPVRLLCTREFATKREAAEEEKKMKRRKPLAKMRWACALNGGTLPPRVAGPTPAGLAAEHERDEGEQRGPRDAAEQPAHDGKGEWHG